MRTLRVGDQCEHVDTVYENFVPKKVRCTVRHHDRSQGAPKQLIAVKEKGSVRFLCIEHSQRKSLGGTVRRQKSRKDDGYGGVQEVLL